MSDSALDKPSTQKVEVKQLEGSNATSARESFARWVKHAKFENRPHGLAQSVRRCTDDELGDKINLFIDKSGLRSLLQCEPYDELRLAVYRAEINAWFAGPGDCDRSFIIPLRIKDGRKPVIFGSDNVEVDLVVGEMVIYDCSVTFTFGLDCIVGGVAIRDVGEIGSQRDGLPDRIKLEENGEAIVGGVECGALEEMESQSDGFSDEIKVECKEKTAL